MHGGDHLLITKLALLNIVCNCNQLHSELTEMRERVTTLRQ